VRLTLRAPRPKGAGVMRRASSKLFHLTHDGAADGRDGGDGGGGAGGAAKRDGGAADGGRGASPPPSGASPPPSSPRTPSGGRTTRTRRGRTIARSNSSGYVLNSAGELKLNTVGGLGVLRLALSCSTR